MTHPRRLIIALSLLFIGSFFVRVNNVSADDSCPLGSITGIYFVTGPQLQGPLAVYEAHDAWCSSSGGCGPGANCDDTYVWTGTDWGDGGPSSWDGPIYGGLGTDNTHTYSTGGDYCVNVEAIFTRENTDGSNDVVTKYTGCSTVTVPPPPSVCGNGVVESGEACDDGSSNGGCPAPCSASCTANSCVCKRTGWADGACNVNGCTATERFQTGIFNPPNCDTASRCVSDSSCSGPPPEPPGTVIGRIFKDDDKDGVYDAGEAYIQDVGTSCSGGYTLNNAVVRSVLGPQSFTAEPQSCNPDPYYAVSVVPGTYTVGMIPPAGWVQTTPDTVVTVPSGGFSSPNPWFGIAPDDLPPTGFISFISALGTLMTSNGSAAGTVAGQVSDDNGVTSAQVAIRRGNTPVTCGTTPSVDWNPTAGIWDTACAAQTLFAPTLALPNWRTNRTPPFAQMTPGQTYTFGLNVNDNGGKNSGWITQTFIYDIPKPTGLTASCSDSGPTMTAMFNWDNAPSATYYSIRIDEGPSSPTCVGNDKCDTPSGLSYTFSAIPGATYAWTLKACNASGCGTTPEIGETFTCPSTISCTLSSDKYKIVIPPPAASQNITLTWECSANADHGILNPGGIIIPAGGNFPTNSWVLPAPTTTRNYVLTAFDAPETVFGTAATSVQVFQFVGGNFKEIRPTGP